MNHSAICCAATLLSLTIVQAASAGDTLDTLLPPPFWLRSHADALNVDTETKQRLEQIYAELEPGYHRLKEKVQKLTEPLYEQLTEDELNEAEILKRTQALLAAENELKLYQIRVRIALMSELSAEQRRAARELARRHPEPDYRKVLNAKVEQVRELSEQLSNRGGSVEEVRQKMQEIEKALSDGKIIEGSRMLDQVIRGLKKALESTSDQ